MFEPMCGRDIAAFAVASTKMEFVGIPARSQGTHDKSPREIHSPYLDKAFVFVNQFCFFSFSCHGVFRGLKNVDLWISWRPKHHPRRLTTNHQTVQIPLSDILAMG